MSTAATVSDGKHVKITKPGENTCKLDGKIHEKAVLKAGMLSGKLTFQKKAKDMKTCIRKCCAQKNCHVAMMTSGMCYSVYCTNPDYCTLKEAPVETLHKKPTLAFVRRGDISFAPESKSSIKNPIKPVVQNPFEALTQLAAFPKLQIPFTSPVEPVTYSDPSINGEQESGIPGQQ